MDVHNERVHHRTYGDGVITGQTETCVTVRFDGGDGEKKFLYPSAFVSFLTLTDPTRQAELEAGLRAIRERREAERRQRDEAEAAQREEIKRTQLELKRAAARKKTAAARKSAKEAKKKNEDEAGA